MAVLPQCDTAVGNTQVTSHFRTQEDASQITVANGHTDILKTPQALASTIWSVYRSFTPFWRPLLPLRTKMLPGFVGCTPNPLDNTPE